MFDLINLLEKDRENLIIADRCFHKALFSETLNQEYLYNIKFITFSELSDDLLGYYDKEALLEIKNDLNLSFEASKLILDSYKLADTNGGRLDYQKFYHLDNNRFNNYLDKNILVFISESYEKEEYVCLNLLKTITNYKEIKLEKKNDKYHRLIKFSNSIVEVENLCNEILSLIDKGISPNNIKVILLNENYEEIIHDCFAFYKVPYTINNPETLYSKEESAEYIKYLRMNGMNPSVDSFISFIDSNKTDQINDYAIINLLKRTKTNDIEFLEYIMKSTRLKGLKYDNAIEVSFGLEQIEYPVSDNDYLFILGANQGDFPIYKEESGLFTENTKCDYEIKDVSYFNKLLDEYYISLINSIKNVYISYKLKGTDKEYIKAVLLNKLSFEFVYEDKDNHDLFNPIRYSAEGGIERDKLIYNKACDIYNKYSFKTDTLAESLYIYYKEHPEGSNIDEKIIKNNEPLLTDKDLFLNLINNKINVSYTALETFFNCPYKYLLDSVYGITPYEANYFTYVGTFFHEFIEKFIDKEYNQADVDMLYEEFRERNEYKLTNENRFYFMRFYNKLEAIHSKIHNQYLNTEFSHALKEKKLWYKKEVDGVEINMKGTADLILIDDDNNVVIIDYKTGAIPKVDIEKGLGLQLFMYYNLLKEHNSKYHLLGVFYQSTKLDEGKDNYLNLKKGTYINDEDLVNSFDKEGLYGVKGRSNNKVSFGEMETKLKIVNDMTEVGIDKILSMDFDPTPSKEACKYCEYKDICLKKIVISDDEDESDKGGDE